MVLMTAAYTKTSSLDMHRVSEGMQMRLGADVMQLALPQGIPTVPEFEETLADLVRGLLTERQCAVPRIIPG